jgi:hypothetical protein
MSSQPARTPRVALPDDLRPVNGAGLVVHLPPRTAARPAVRPAAARSGAGSAADRLERMVMLLGFCIAMLGFGLWMYFVFTTFVTAPPDVLNPFAGQLAPRLPLAALAAFTGGAFVVCAGGSR